MKEFVYEKLQSINRDWELAHSEALRTLAPHIAESWKRSFSFGVDSDMAELPPVVEQDRTIASDSSRNAHDAAGPGLDVLIGSLNQSLEPLGVAVFLANQSLRIFQACGSTVALQELEQRNMAVGALLSERSAGTSALSLAYLSNDPYTLEPDECYSRIFAGYHAIARRISPASDIYLMMLIPEHSPLPSATADAFAIFIFDAFAALFGHNDTSKIPMGTQVLSLVLRSQSSGYAVIDSDGRVVELDSRLIASLGGIPPQNVQGISIVGLFPPLKPLIPLARSYVRDNRRLGMLGAVRFRDKNYRISCAPVISDDGKRLIALISTCLSDESPLTIDGNRSDYLLGESDAAIRLRKRIRTAAENDINILISGEAGTDKEHIAGAIHSSSRRTNGPFISVRCSSFECAELRMRLFGANERLGGGGCGALSDARGGTLFLDEIEAMPLEIQSALIHRLEEQDRLMAQGSVNRSDTVRVIASTTCDLSAMVRNGSIRADLYYLLSTFSVKTIPLRDRRDDIPSILRAAAQSTAQRYGTDSARFSDGAISMLIRHSWPGNMRELHRMLLRINYEYPGRTVTAKEIPLLIGAEPQESGCSPDDGIPAKQALCHEPLLPAGNEPLPIDPRRPDGADSADIEEALAEAHGNKTMAARRLGITRQTLYNRMRKAGMC